MFQIKTIFAALLVMLFFTGCATETVEVANFSGYIGNYEGLKKTKDELGNEVLRWQSSLLIPGWYNKLMIDEIVFYPEGKATPQISEKVLIEIRRPQPIVSRRMSTTSFMPWPSDSWLVSGAITRFSQRRWCMRRICD